MDKVSRMGASQATLDTALRRGVAYVARVQRADGGFDSFSSPSVVDFAGAARVMNTTFVPALVLGALAEVDTAGARRACQRTADFVLRQQSPQWSFNYWAKGSPQRQKQPYPDDLDDTFCALAGLARYQPELVTAEMLAAVVKLLLSAETAVGGPYRTWLVAPDSPAVWRDTDVAVNANVAYFLSLIGTPVPQLTAYLERAISVGRLRSPYYPSSYPIAYYLARGYQGQQAEQLIHSLGKQPAKAANPLHDALLLSTLLRLGKPAPAAVAKRLLAAQGSDGSWPGSGLLH